MFLYVQEVQGVVTMINAISDYSFNAKPKLYNSERREVVGSITWYNNNTELYPNIGTNTGGGEDNTGYQHFYVDTTDTSTSNKKEVVLFTYANGVKVKGSYYLGSNTETEMMIWMDVSYYDKDDNRLTAINTWSTSINCTKRYGATPDNFEFYFCPCSVYYGNLRENHHGKNYNDIAFISPRNSGSPYEPIPVNGVYNTSERFNYYYRTAHTLYESDWNNFWNAIVNGGDGTPISPIMPSEDTSGTGGGDVENPDYNPFTDPIDFPDLPTFSALTTGLISAYNPSNSALRILGEKLWSDFFIEEIKKINNDPMEAVISLHLLPFEVLAPTSAHCMVGNYDTEINMPVISQEFVYVEGGEFTVNERFASALDYSPYTKVYIHIPYVGIVPLDVDYIMKKHLHLKYQVDVLTGGAVAMLMCDNAILYNFPCNLAMSIPLTSSNHKALYDQLLNATASVAHMAIAGGASGGNVNPMTFGHSIVNATENALGIVTSKHSEVQKSGAITGVQGALDSFETYLIFHRPIQSLASNFGHFKGFPCNVTYTLSSLSGYTEVEYAHLEGVTALDAEKEEIQTLLRAGVIL